VRNPVINELVEKINAIPAGLKVLAIIVFSIDAVIVLITLGII
jgi:hypothetical protein